MINLIYIVHAIAGIIAILVIKKFDESIKTPRAMGIKAI
jgi:hypothetical protein